jgi:hypothetical protein
MKTWFTNEVWPWLKWALSGLALILMGVFAFGAYKRKVGGLKDKNKVTKALSDVKVLEVKRDAHVAKETELEVIDGNLEVKGNKLETKIAASKKKAVEVSESVEGKTDAEVADRFNELFRS